MSATRHRDVGARAVAHSACAAAFALAAAGETGLLSWLIGGASAISAVFAILYTLIDLSE